ncbi:MAG: hypothetical protein RL033_2379 [Pseudomonadota bacterium]
MTSALGALLRRGDRVRALVRDRELARWVGFKPLIVPGEQSFLLWNAHVDASKARQELRFAPTPAQRGLAKTVEWLSRSR